MSWLLFLDESGHDHQIMPYEVRGGIALHAKELWPFIQEVKRLELSAFGAELFQYKTEIKGTRLLSPSRFKWANQAPVMPDEERRKHSRGFLTKGLEHKKPTYTEFTAFGQACLEMTRGLFQTLRTSGAVLFASAIPATVVRPTPFKTEEYLRKDHVFLLERFFYFLEYKKEHGLLVMDQEEKNKDRRFVARLHRYFERTQTGRLRSQWIVPSPFFVSSDMAYPIQAADICIYCVNWGYRVAAIGMNARVRNDIAPEFGPWLRQLEYVGDGHKDGHVFKVHSVVYVPDPYTSR